MERRAIAIQGTVQGVGFRPFVHRLASELRLGGFVKNQTGGVSIEVEGEGGPLDEFLAQLVSKLPSLAHIDEISWHRELSQGDRIFRIESSEQVASGQILIPPDVATCEDCLAELFDPRDRRYRYPFLNCTNCGPRLTIVTGAPYDRERTTMAASRCARLAGRNMKIRPTADFTPSRRPARYAGRDFRRWMREGGQLKRMIRSRWFAGGNAGRKNRRDEGSWADITWSAMRAMPRRSRSCGAANIAMKNRSRSWLRISVAAKALCEIDALEEELLTSRRRPIVLLRKRRHGCSWPMTSRREIRCLG